MGGSCAKIRFLPRRTKVKGKCGLDRFLVEGIILGRLWLFLLLNYADGSEVFPLLMIST